MRKGHRLALLLACIALGMLSWLAARRSAPDERPDATPAVAGPANAPPDPAREMAVARSGTGAAPHAGGDAQEPALQACMSDYDAALARRLAGLADSTDARTQLVRSLLSTSDGDDRSGADALERALRTGPRDPLVAWMAASQCAAPDCDPAAAVERLVAAEPDNAAAWLKQLEVAYRAGDTVAIDRALSAAARSTRYDDHFGDAAVEIATVLQDVPWPGSCRNAAEVTGHRMGLGRPATQLDEVVLRTSAIAAALVPSAGVGVSRICNAKALVGQPGREAACRAALAHMADSDTMVARMLALHLLVPLTAGRADGPFWREQLRQLEYLLAQGVRLPSDAAAAFRGWETGEIPALQARLRTLHRWPPPPAWLPTNPRARTLVTTGQLPSEAP